MSLFRVYYMRPDWFREGIIGAHPDLTDLNATHVFVREVEAANLNHVYHLCQAEVWSPNGEARNLIRAKGLAHTSMSVGDVIIDHANHVHVVASFGFDDLGAKP